MAKRAMKKMGDGLQEGKRETTGEMEAPKARGEMTKAARKLLHPGRCRAYMRKALATEFEEIVEGFVEAAKTGSVPHVKLATELLKPTRKASTKKKNGLAAKMLMEWKNDLAGAARKREEMSGQGVESDVRGYTRTAVPRASERADSSLL